MLICMKPDRKLVDDLAEKIAAARDQRGLSNAEIGRISGVHPSQASRICSGHFKTLSHNVVRICNTVGVEAPTSLSLAEADDPAWHRVEQSVRKLWDETAEGARKIEKMLDAIADLRAVQKDQPLS
jgi:transcriptional regulator with XRE-family HTH domain